ncbi:CotH kinase family protein, partial [bacterium]|nr:CotH kinase family protein [bacterium]
AINEFLAANTVTLPDQDGEFDDWIELYNFGEETLMLSGFYLTDNEDDLQQWSLPDTFLAPGEFMMLWADNDEDQDGLHTNFRLFADGEVLILSNGDGIVDEIDFGVQRADVSYGRYPDGTGEYREMYPTPGEANVNDAPSIEPELTIFGDTLIHTINLEFYISDWQDSLTYNFEVLDKEYMPVRLTFDGMVRDSTGIRYKGNSSYTLSSNTPKKPLQLKFDEFFSGQSLGGIKRLNMQNGVSDPSFMRETIAYGIARSILPAPRTAYADVFVNGELLGFYILVEEIDKTFLEDHFEDNSGNLFKASNNGATMQWYGDGAELYADEFELKTNEDVNDWGDLLAMLDALNNSSDESAISSLDPLLDIDACLRAFAFNMVLSSFDSYTGSGRNFYLYHDPVSDKLTFLPWDVNESFGIYTNGWDVVSQDVYQTSNLEHRPLIRRLLTNDSLRQIYISYLDLLLTQTAATDSVSAKTETLRPIIESHVFADQNKLYSDAQFTTNIEQDVTVDIGRRIPGLLSFSEARNLNVSLQISSSFVYPGDTDNNGVVDAQDILPVGVYFLAQGPARLDESYVWMPQAALLWDEPAALYADANGDGIVDERDIIAIGVNWQNTHEVSTASYEVDITDPAVLSLHQTAFQLLYESLRGNSDTVREMKAMLESILDELPQTARTFELRQNYPNPFNGETTISFVLPQASQVTLRVNDILGRLVALPIDKANFTEGNHHFSFSLADAPSGIYFYRMTAGEFSAVRKMLLVR